MPFNKKKLNRFDPTQLEKQFNFYRDSVGLTSGLRTSDAFKKYQDTRLVDHYSLSNLITTTADKREVPALLTPENISIERRLAGDDPEKEWARNQINHALDLKQETTAAGAEFQHKINVLNAQIASNRRFSMEAIGSQLQEARIAARHKILEQQAAETGNIENLFTQDRFLINLGFNPENVQAIEKFKSNMLSEIKSSHTKNLDAFDKALNDEINQLHIHSQEEFNRISFLGTLYNHSKAMRQQLAKLELKNNTNAHEDLPELEIDANTSAKGRAIFKNIKVTDLDFIETTTGRRIGIQANGSGGHTFHMEMPRFGPFYFKSKRVDVDMTYLAKSMISSGHNKANFKVNAKDPEMAMELGRKMYAAAVRAGYDPTLKGKDGKSCDFSIIVNGEKKTASELFKDHPRMLRKVHEDYAKANAKYEGFKKNPRSLGADQKALKQAINAGRPPVPAPVPVPAPALGLGGHE